MLVHSVMLAVAATALFWLWIAAHFAFARGNESFDAMQYLVYCGIVAAAFGVDLVISKVRGTDLLQLDLQRALRLTFRQALTILGTVLFFLVAFKDHTMSRLFLFTFIPVLYGMLLVLNRVFPAVLANFLFKSARRERTLLFGSACRADGMAEWLQRKSKYGMELVGLVTDDADTGSSEVRVLGRTNDLEEVIERHGVTQLIGLHLPDPVSCMEPVGELCDRLGVRVLIVNDLQERFKRPISFFEDGGMRFVSLREEPLECPFNRIVKRILDIALALPIVAFVLPPISLFVAIAHRLQSPGPLLFRQDRTGIRFQSFSIFKFRTMHVNHGDEARQATQDDVRVFRLGRWLRKLSIDELPQFINVLLGHMSIVGPRPHMLEHDDMFAKVASTYNVRTLVKPGITGLAQVRGFRGEAITDRDVVKRVESDVYYLENWSLLMDWSIILKTAWQVIAPQKTAY
jgi:exopolysaccharide biosynthesis polyprenyl glycosylphosphotransferase